MAGQRDPYSGQVPPELAHLVLSEAELQSIVAHGVREGVKDVLLTIGIDVSTPEAILQHQLDVAYMRRSRKASEQIQKIGAKVILTTFVTGLLAAAWLGLGDMIRKGLGH